jgi:hypothetical protein
MAIEGLQRHSTIDAPPLKEDVGAASVLDNVPSKGPIDAQQMHNIIRDATKDADGQAAGLEFTQIQDFAQKNWDRLTPEAKKQFEIYEKAATAALKEGHTGIATDKYDKMLGEMDRALPSGGDGDGVAKPDLAQHQWGHIESPPQWGHVEQPPQWGHIESPPHFNEMRPPVLHIGPKLSSDDLKGMVDLAHEMKADHHVHADDASTRKALVNLDHKLASKGANGSISGSELANTITKAVGDKDGQAAGVEYHDIKRYTNEQKEKMSPAAQRVMDVYDKYARKAESEGRTGFTEKEFAHMKKDMAEAAKPRLSDFAAEFKKLDVGLPENVGRDVPKPTYADQGAGKAIDDLNQHQGSAHLLEKVFGMPASKVGGNELTDAIAHGTEDADNEAAGTEYHDFHQWSIQNRDQLSPSAQRVMTVYDQYARQAQSEGRTGLSPDEYKHMLADMRESAKPTLAESIEQAVVSSRG